MKGIGLARLRHRRQELANALTHGFGTLWGIAAAGVLVTRVDDVEEKVLHFPTQRMEEIVRRVTDRELRLIVRLGYVLGAGIGLILVGIRYLLGG